MLPKEEIEKLITLGKIKEALKTFLENLPENDTENRNRVLLLNSRFFENERAFMEGTIKDNDYGVENTRIAKAILSFADEYIAQDNSSQTLLDKAINALPLSKDADLGILQLVNCDRIKPVKKFKNLFDDNKEAKIPFQFYFISGCPDEMPGSLAERILYEIMERESLELNTSIHYPFEEGDFKRVKIETLPLSASDVAGSKKKFKEYVQKRFAFTNTESFEKFIETGIPKLPYSHVTTIFKITESNWEEDEGEIVEYLQWMIDTFQTAHPNVPTFIFLFVVQVEHLYDESKVRKSSLRIINQMEAFCEKNTTALFREIVPIKKMHLEDWFSDLGINNPKYYDAVIDEFIKSLKPNDILEIEGEQRFHMKDVEPIQEKVIKTFRHKT